MRKIVGGIKLGKGRVPGQKAGLGRLGAGWVRYRLGWVGVLGKGRVFARLGWVGVMGMLLTACATPAQKDRTLRAPAGTPPTVVAMMEEGNRLFNTAQWEGAKAQYEAAIKTQPSLAEAHYNLAWVLNTQGDEAAARRHFMEAATLAPGNKVIWDSPPLRQHGKVEGQAKPGTPFLPAMGVH